MTPRYLLAAQVTGTSREYQQALLRMRAFYRQTGDVFSKAELERLNFVRWLYRTGQVDS
jgi:hypothetical protein